VSVSPNTSLDGSDQLPSPPETGASISITALNRTARKLRLRVPSSLRSSAAG
jgi:hypothetical protein